MTKLWRVHVNDEAAVSMTNKWKHERHKAKQQATPRHQMLRGVNIICYLQYNQAVFSRLLAAHWQMWKDICRLKGLMFTHEPCEIPSVTTLVANE